MACDNCEACLNIDGAGSVGGGPGLQNLTALPDVWAAFYTCVVARKQIGLVKKSWG